MIKLKITDYSSCVIITEIQTGSHRIVINKQRLSFSHGYIVFFASSLFFYYSNSIIHTSVVYHP